ncbi:hypothetical protein WJX73_008837 [Symbiochloris irregularis]|uniref:RNA polymerase II transcription factor B subunit 2 n=1 Tax=Symbiochloris irregularis TaxID=706552 RepID=A0AAW1NVQ0_9CHLO
MDLISYLEGLPPSVVGALYSSPWTCRAVVRGIPPLAKQYVMRMVLLDQGVAEGVIDAWPKASARSQHATAMRKLGRLQLLTLVPKGQQASVLATLPPRDNERAFRLHPEVQRQLRKALVSGVAAQSQTLSQSVNRALPSSAQLEDHAVRQWEGLLSFLHGSTPQPPLLASEGPKPKLDIIKLLQSAQLQQGNRGKRELTASGFRFMLMDTYHQLWLLLRAYIDLAKNQSGAELASVVSFLLQLGGHEAAQPISLASMQANERDICADLALLGLLLPFRDGEGGSWACPTRLAMALGGSGSAEAQQEVSQGYIIVETNYRMYAYTSSTLQRAVLDLFVRCEAVLPNLYIGTLTRESVIAALAKGLDSEQLLTFLRRHAHPRALQRSPVVPEVVGDQMRLWQAQTRRLKSDAAQLYQQFGDVKVWRASVERAKELGIWLWDHEPSRRLAARVEGHPQMREFIRSQQ